MSALLARYPFLRHLAAREELVRNGKLTTIIYIRDKNSKGQEVSGYIDYAHRLKTEPFELYFERKKKLVAESACIFSLLMVLRAAGAFHPGSGHGRGSLRRPAKRGQRLPRPRQRFRRKHDSSPNK